MIPSPIFASPGMVTGSVPVIGISPNRAFTAAISEVWTGENVAIKELTSGKARSR
jgi:hypothetical protein